MKPVFAILLFVALAGCSSVTYYAPESDANAYRGGNACVTVVAYQASLGDSIRLFALAQPRPSGVNITITFRVPRGESVQLLSPQFTIRSDSGAPKILNIAHIVSGSTALRIPIVKFSPTELLRGADRYEQLEPPHGPDDVFLVELALATSTLPSRLEVQLPEILANGRAVATSPVSFVLRSETRALCIQ